MNATALFTSSIGKKFIMALSGLVLFGFVLGHMVGNLQVFLGPEALNRYGAFLHGIGELLWLVRFFLFAMVVLHIWSAAALTRENRAARPQPYAHQELVAASYASRTMIWSGIIIAAFVVYHLMHFTLDVSAINGVPGKGHDFTELMDDHVPPRHDVYSMVLLGFRNPWVSGFYALALILLCSHLGHGVGAMFQSLGLKNPAWAPRIDIFARAISWAICLGYLSIPISIYFFNLGKPYLQSRGYLP